MTDRRLGFARHSFGIALSVLLTTGAVAGAQAASDVRLQDVTVTTQPDSVTIIVKTSGEAKYQAELMDRPNRLVIDRSEEHTSELQSPCNLVCRLLLEQK